MESETELAFKENLAAGAAGVETHSWAITPVDLSAKIIERSSGAGDLDRDSTSAGGVCLGSKVAAGEGDVLSGCFFFEKQMFSKWSFPISQLISLGSWDCKLRA